MSPDETKITDEDFPAIYRAADQNSLRAQKRFLGATRLRLSLVVTAAFFGIFSWHAGGSDVAGIVSACAFAGALIAEIYLLRVRPDRVWYQGRAVAESAKTLTWRYLVGGAPFEIGMADTRDGEEGLLRRFEEIADEFGGAHLVPVAGGGNQISTAMRSTRALSNMERRNLYRHVRIEGQRDWYARMSRWNERRASAWSAGLALMEACGLVAAILKATGVFDVDLLGFAAALIGAGSAWAQAKQHQTLASAYAIASQELADINSRIDWNRTEEQWSQFVDQAEEAISREHTLWRGSHSA